MLHSNLLASTVPLRDTSLPSPVIGSIRHSDCAPPPGLLSTNACLSSAEKPTGKKDRPTNGALFSTRLRSEEHTSELQSLMRISYAVFCLKKTTSKTHQK